MIPVARPDVLDTSLLILAQFGMATDVRGRFVALYLGLRRMGDAIAPLGAGPGTPASEMEQFLDRMWTKVHREEPFVVLTAPFGGSTSPTAPYSTRTGVVAPGHSYATNTWRNNFGIQKGIGCPAEPEVITSLLGEANLRLACPHMKMDPEGRRLCGIDGATYRGEEHSIWLRRTEGSYQVVDLNLPAVYEGYLRPKGERIPIFPLIGVLYSMSPEGVYPTRAAVGIPDFAEDFAFELDAVEGIFDCDPDSPRNAALLALAQGVGLPPAPAPAPAAEAPAAEPAPAAELPELAPAGQINTGVGAELAVAAELQARGWHVLYRGNQRGIGYDLEATRDDQTLRVEVKSSVSFTMPELLESEWDAAQRHDEEYVLAVVDFYGSERQEIWYVRNPAGTAVPVERATRVFRLVRTDIRPLGTDAEFL